jgi:hypothetical protein
MNGSAHRSTLRRMKTRLLVLLAVCLSAVSLFAQKAIQFDFNDNSGSYNGTESPAHAAGTLSLTNTTWNVVTNDVPAGLSFADGTPAAAVSFDVGQSATFTGAIAWNDTPPLGTDDGAGIYNTPLGNDNFYTSSDRQLGVRVRGLTPGTYRVYSIGRGTPADQLHLSYVQSIGINLDNQTAVTPTIGPAADPPLAWVNGQTHLEAIVTVTSPLDWVTVVSRLDNQASHPAHALQGLQIVPIDAAPLPSAVPALDPPALVLLALAIGVAAFIALRR